MKPLIHYGTPPAEPVKKRPFLLDIALSNLTKSIAYIDPNLRSWCPRADAVGRYLKPTGRYDE